jgi:hypothetical protein
MRIRVGSKNSVPDFYIDDIYPLFKHNSVISIVSCNHTISLNTDFDYGWDIFYDENNSSIEQYYFMIDNMFNEAFAHWVYESGIYLVLFHKLKNIYPNIKILNCFSTRNYKKSFYDAFDIDENDIVTSIENINNCIIFPKYTTHHDGNLGELYGKYLTNFYSILMSKIDPIIKDVDVMYFPRGTLENYSGNDRKIVNQDSIIELVKSYSNSLIYYTDNTKNIIDQINIVKKAKILIVDYGANFFVNGSFAENTHIIVLGTNIVHEYFPGCVKIFEQIKERNSTVTFIHSTSGTFNFSLEDIKLNIDKFISI